jgi:prepilin-type processing-associated H-X9-DG protein
MAAATMLSIYICPTVPRSSYLCNGRGVTDYGGINGTKLAADKNDPPNGVMLYDQAIRVDDIRDGTTNTLIVSEDSAWMDGQWINGENVFEVVCKINSDIVDNEIRSNHPGGANGLFCDGSVRFLNEETNLKTLAAICTRAGGEIVDEF